MAGERCGTAQADGESHGVAALTPGDGGSVQLALPELRNLRGAGGAREDLQPEKGMAGVETWQIPIGCGEMRETVFLLSAAWSQ